MKIRGEVFSGVLRGTPLIEKYSARLIGILGFRPFKGTMDIKLERSVDITAFSTKSIEHVISDGTKKINAYLAPVKVKKLPTIYKLIEIHDRERQLVKNLENLGKAAEEKFSIRQVPEISEATYDCWAVQFKNGIYDNGTIELVSQHSIKEKLNLEDGDKVEIEFSDMPAKKNKFKIKMNKKPKVNKKGL